MIRLGSALFNADHTRLGEELRRAQEAGVDFFHLDVFDGYFVPDQAFPARTIRALRPLTQRPFEIHLAVNDAVRFLRPLAESGADLILLPAESTPLLYETIYAVRELKMKVGLCLALGTSLEVLFPVLPLIDTVLLLGRVTGEGKRGREFNRWVVDRVRAVRQRIDEGGYAIDLQAAGGLETSSCVEVCRAGATSLPLGAALHRESDLQAFIRLLRERLASEAERPAQATGESAVPEQNECPAQVLVASRSFGKNCPDVIERMKSAGCSFLKGFDRSPTEEELLQRIGEADVLISGTEPVTARVIAAGLRLKIIAKHGVGYDNIDVETARARQIPVAIAGPAVIDSVADLTIGLLLALARQIPQGHGSVRAGRWDRFVGSELRGKTLGIIGLGQIGKAVCRRAAGFGLNIVASDAFPDSKFAESWGVEFVGLEELLRRADYVSLHAPSNPQTRGLIGAREFEQMKPSACLINTARGDLVDEGALCDALRSRRIAGAALDVFSKEPLEPGNALLTLDNVIAMPHCAGQTVEALRRLGEITAENVLRMLRGQPPLYAVE